jgi:phosphatidylglycerophosphate synthase
MIKNKEDKYGDDEKFESWADLNIFAPIAKKMVDPLYNLGMTPNMVTLISTIFTLSSIYFLHIGNKKLAVFSYIFGYLLDCVDGRMARKYNLGSDIGMAFDCVSDNISNLILFIYILSTRPYNQQTIIFICILFFMSGMLSLSYGLNEAVSAYEASKKSECISDNFYKRRVNQLKDTELTNTRYETILYSIFLLINKLSYTSYRSYFPEYDKQKIYEKLKILKHFGPGNYCIIVSIMLLYI